MDFQFLVWEVKDGVGVIRLNRPDDGNAITLEMARELNDAAGLCDSDPGVRAVVLTGTGKMFCAGGDLKTFTAQGDKVSRYMQEVTAVFHAAVSRFNRMDPPVVAAVNGTAAGGGLSLALAADIVIAAASARFTMAYTKIGLVPDGGSTYFLARLVGLRRAKDMVLLNPVLTAQQALEWGLINQVAADDEVLPAALSLAGKLAAGPTRAYGEAKRLILASATETLEAQMDRESKAIANLVGGADGQEGLSAFLEKRPPKFTGR